MRKRREKESAGFNVWRSYSDMMAGILLLFVLIMCVTLFQSQVNYENSLKERDEKLLLQEEYTKEIMSQKEIMATQKDQLTTQQDKITSQDALLAAQKAQLDDLAARLAAQQNKLEELGVTLTTQQAALYEKTQLLAVQQERIDKIIGVKADVIEALKTEFSNNNIKVQIDESNGSMVLDSSVLFAYDEVELTEEGQTVLGEILPIYCSVLLQDQYYPYLAEIMIDGYTDSSGDYQYNLELSQKRSLAVAEYLLYVSEDQLSAENRESLRQKFSVNGHSSSHLILDESGMEDAQASRRVEVKFRLKDEEMIQELRDILNS